MSGAIPPIPEYAFITWCLFKAQGLYHFNVIFPSMSRSSAWFFPSGFRVKILFHVTQMIFFFLFLFLCKRISSQNFFSNGITVVIGWKYVKLPTNLYDSFQPCMEPTQFHIHYIQEIPLILLLLLLLLLLIIIIIIIIIIIN